MTDISYVRTQDAPVLPPPPSSVGALGWIRANLIGPMADFSSVGAGLKSLLTILATIGILWFGLKQIWAFLDFMFLSAVWSDPTGAKRGACTTVPQGGLLPDGTQVGACWPYLSAKLKLFIYGRYDEAQLWRPNLTFLMGAAGLFLTLWEKSPIRKQAALFTLLLFPIIAFVLLTGGNLAAGRGFWLFIVPAAAILLGLGWLGRKGLGGEFLGAFGGAFTAAGALAGYIAFFALMATMNFGLTTVVTNDWGGLLVTLVVAVTGIVASLPLGVLLALGRRSRLPAIRYLSIVFIEFWRGVPLITVLFMSSVMLPMFLPPGTNMNNLLRALIGVAIFASAYMAEVVRGGLQAIPKGQNEGAMALGLGYGQMMRLIILPQALTLVIPGIVNTFIGLFKDTTLVLIIGLFDLLGQINNTFADPTWATPTTTQTGYFFAAMFFFVFCFGMSRYSMAMERKLRRGHKR